MSKWMSIAVFLLVGTVSAQDTLLPADSANLRTIEGMIQSYYTLLSNNPSGTDWNRLQAYFHPDAQVNAINYSANGSIRERFGGREAYVKNAKRFISANNFYQEEIFRKVYYFGNMAQVWSTYYLTYSRPGTKARFEDRGIISFQLIFDQGRWWISNILWNSEDPYAPVPGKYLPESNNATATEQIFKINEVEVRPLYQGGDLALIRKIYPSILAVPDSAHDTLRGPLSLSFVVEPNGLVEEIKIISSPHPKISERAKDIIRKSVDFRPGMKDGNPVRVAYPKLSIEFIEIPKGK